MSRRRFLLLTALLLTLFAFVGAVSAQDGDGDGLPDTADRCPAQAGPRENGGCPLPATTPEVGADDRDGDGVADFVDACPDQAGTGFTNGCPVEVNPVGIQPTAVPPQLVMVWDSMDVCMVGVPLNARGNVNVREQPTTNSAVLGQLVPGQQFEPWFRDYDENNQVWFGGAPVDDTYGWVSGAVVIDNGQCVYLPQVIHVDADPGLPFVEVSFDPSIIPLPELPDDEGDGFSLDDLLDLDIVVIDWSDLDLTPDDGTITPTPQGNAGRSGPHVKVFDGSNLHLNFLDGDGSVIPLPAGFKPFIFGHPKGADEECTEAAGFCVDAVLLLPAVMPTDQVGDPTGLCDTDQLLAGLDALSNGEDNTLIGLLLPAVQKVREAAARMRMGDGSVVPGGDVMQDFHFRALTDFLADPPGEFGATCGVVMVNFNEDAAGQTHGNQGILLLLPAV